MSSRMRMRLGIILGSLSMGALTSASALLPQMLSAQCLERYQFEEQLIYPTGISPAFVATADFNEDGIVDLAVAESYQATSGIGSSVSILLGNGAGGVGDGTFGPSTSFPTGHSPYGIAVGDFNSDDILDLALTNYQHSTVAVLLGQGIDGVGDGTFAFPTWYFTGQDPYHLVTADFNEDGVLDLAVTNNASANVSILLGQGSGGSGDGTFSYPEQIPLNHLSTGIATADLNEDGILDLVATENYLGMIAVLIGQGAGGVGEGAFVVDGHYPAGPEPFKVEIADLDSDGILDVAVANGDDGGTWLLFGNGADGVGDGTFDPSSSMLPSGNTGAIAIEDFNGDGLLDIAVTTLDARARTTLRLYNGYGSGGNNNGSFDIIGATDYQVGKLPLGIAVEDFNQDGKLDAAVPNHNSDHISVLIGACIAGPPVIQESPQLVEVRDVAGDQGGSVQLEWLPSSKERTDRSVDAYRVWRRIPPSGIQKLLVGEAGSPGARVCRTKIASPEGEPVVVFWEALAELPAQRIERYLYTAATTQDSLPGSNPYTAFFITALTEDIDTFYNSNIDSGYSVDNLSPATPRNLVGAFETTGGIVLAWDPNAETDFSHYAVYGGSTGGFVPSEDNRIGTGNEPRFVDVGRSVVHYKVSAFDTHANESGHAGIASGDIPISADDPSTRNKIIISPAAPNPFTDRTYFAYVIGSDLAAGVKVPVSLKLYGPGGRLVRTLISGFQGPGEYRVFWDGTSSSGVQVGAGVYFCLFRVTTEVRQEQVVFIR